MSFPRYPDYKDSGVEWLGEVPGHWEVGPVKRHIARVESGTSVNSSDEPAEDGKLGVLKTSCVYTGKFEPTENKTVVLEDIGRVSCPLKAGTIIVSRMNTPELIGAAGFVDSAPSNLFLPDRLWQIYFSNADARFVHFWTLTSLYRAQVESVCTGTSSSMKNLGQDQFGSFAIAMPPKEEQTQIAAFLDRETAKIDELVREQRRLMELLKEKRQAVISHAVTKGLNPHAPMKPSGIEWLGDVPAGWTTPAMYMRYSTELGKMLDTAKISGTCLIPYMRNVDVQWGAINFEDLPSMDIHENDYERYTVKSGDLLVCEGGEVGRAAIVPQLSGIFGYQKALHRLRALDGGEDSTFMFFTLLWAANTGIFNQGGSSTIAHLTGEQLRKYRFPKPPVSEQKEIVAFLETELAKFDTLTAEAQRAIDLLQERRTALISAAVTGQIDVRQHPKN